MQPRPRARHVGQIGSEQRAQRGLGNEAHISHVSSGFGHFLRLISGGTSSVTAAVSRGQAPALAAELEPWSPEDSGSSVRSAAHS